jgi:hypothetical protein
VDPIHPIAPGPPSISQRPPVEPLERITRERDRPSRDAQQRKRRESSATPVPELGVDDEGRPHVDVRV